MRAAGPLFLLLAAAACATGQVDTDEIEAVRWGTSFGMCLGYCVERLEVTPTQVRLTVTSRDSVANPPRTYERATTPAEWQSLTTDLQAVAFDRLNETYGCPDCADGGAEWVEVDDADLEKRVTYEYGKSPAEIADVAARLRAIRETLPRPE